jgi:hypothetical protein
MVHAALLLLMLEAVNADLVFTISLKRSTQNLQLSTSWPADYPIFWPSSTLAVAQQFGSDRSNSGHAGRTLEKALLTQLVTSPSPITALRKVHPITASAMDEGKAGTPGGMRPSILQRVG